MRILKNIFTASVVTCLLALPAVAASTSVASASSVEVVEVVRAAESTQTTSGISFECKTECLSNWYKSSASFSAVVFNFSELAERELREIESLEHEHVEPGAFVQFEYLDGGLSKWVYFEPDIDGTTTYTERTALVNTKTATGFRVKHSLEEDFINGFELLGLNTTKSAAASETVSARRNLLAGVDFLELGVIPRTVWGGFEKTHSKLKLLASRSFLPNFSQLYKVDDPEILQVSGFKDNKALFWPREYAKDIKMIVIHHTASTRELDNPTQAIKNIHEYHTNVKQWGDIGYHYIVAPDGKIFEGRAGGPGVIGGHSYDVNKVSVGISVMGNYESDQVSNATMQALAKLIEKLVLQHDLDINAKVAYKNMQIDVLAGHRDTGKTLCPGKNLYSRLNELRSWVSSNLELNPKAFKLGSANDFKLAGNSKKTIQISLTNKSSDTWQRGKTKLLPKSTEARAYLQGNMQWQMVRGSGKPNTTNIFEANLETLNNAGFKSLELEMLHNNRKYEQTLFVNLIVSAEDLSYKFGAKSHKLTVKTGAKKELKIKLRNTSDTDFDAKNPIYLAVLNSDSSQDLLKINSNRINLKAGAYKEIKLDVVGAGRAGSYIQKLGLLSKSNGVIDGPLLEFAIDVASSKASNRLSSKTRNLKMQYTYNSAQNINQWKSVQLRIPNKTQNTWERDKFIITTLTDFNTFLTLPKLRQKRVRPGETAIVNLKIRTDNLREHTVLLRFFYDRKLLYNKFTRIFVNHNQALEPSLALSGASAAKSQPAAGSANALNTNANNRSPVVKSKEEMVTNNAPKHTALGSKSKVPADSANSASSTASSAMGPSVRVHITKASLSKYQISCNTEFISNLGGLQKHPAKKVLEINISSPNQEVARFEPLDANGICEVINLQRSPAWNPALNDNKFRGILELRFDDNQAILINELALESYLKGLGEVSNSSHVQKAKTIMVAARSYAYYYLTAAKKFTAKPYDLNDDPGSTQKYIGYGMELRSPLIVKAVQETAGEVVKYNQQAIKVPYFNQSAGFTKSAKEVWGWQNLPYLNGVKDPYCKQTQFLGHGVGISGCGASGMAREGFDYKSIINYYLPGTKVQKIY